MRSGFPRRRRSKQKLARWPLFMCYIVTLIIIQSYSDIVICDKIYNNHNQIKLVTLNDTNNLLRWCRDKHHKGIITVLTINGFFPLNYFKLYKLNLFNHSFYGLKHRSRFHVLFIILFLIFQLHFHVCFLHAFGGEFYCCMIFHTNMSILMI